MLTPSTPVHVGPPAAIRADLHRAVQDCLTAIREHPRHLWDAPGIWLGAGRRPVRGVVTSLRRELEYHHVDLAAGYQPANWPDDFAATELSPVTAWMNRAAHDPYRPHRAADRHQPARRHHRPSGGAAGLAVWSQ